MAIRSGIAAAFLGFCGLVCALPTATTGNLTIASNAQTSLTLMYQNNLNVSDDVNHIPFLILDAVPTTDAATACAAFSESLLDEATINAYASDFDTTLGYLHYSNQFGNGPSQTYQIKDSIVVVESSTGKISVQSASGVTGALPVLCTQSSYTLSSNVTSEISVSSGTNTFVGSRSRKSFGFVGIPYADKPTRFEYSNIYSGKGQTVQATSFGSQCAQPGGGTEDCLFLNIYTPHIPKSGSSSNLRPVMFWIHGGGFTGGAGSQTDGSELVSREDIVFVSINYRLSTLGFLAVPNTTIDGNFGIADQITALKWTIQNIAAFGGDPGKITIVGESAGAGSVRVLLGSPPAIGKFQGAISMSNLGGGVSLGLTSDYSTTYSSYLTVEESYTMTEGLFAEAGCNQTTVEEQISCLKTVPALPLVNQATVARYVVQDGTYVDTEQLIVNVKNSSTAHVPVMFGVMADDGASIISYPKSPVASELDGLQSILYISEAEAQSVISSGLFPFPNTGNLTLDTFNVTARLYTDAGFRCTDEATVYAGRVSGAFPAAYFYEFDRSIGGYDPNNVGNPPISPGYPRGNPNLPYFRVHAGDVESTFGTISPDQIREPQDLYFAQLVSGYWGEFTKSHQPNPNHRYLQARGYTQTIEAIEMGGTWDPVEAGSQTGPVKRLNWPPATSDYLEVPQCSFLNYSLSYYLDSNRG